MWPIEPIHYVGCASPAALLFQNGTLDTDVPAFESLPYLEEGSEPKTIRWYLATHRLDRDGAAFRDQAEWLGEKIGISVQEQAVPVDPQVLGVYAGRYQEPGGIIVTICVDGKRIFLLVPDETSAGDFAGEYELYAESENRFRLGLSNFEIMFNRNESGEVDRLVLTVEGESLEAKKMPAHILADFPVVRRSMDEAAGRRIQRGAPGRADAGPPARRGVLPSATEP